MNNAALEALIADLGDRICMIIFDNNAKVHIGYKSSYIKSVSELQLKVFGGVDFVGIKRQPNDPKLQRLGVTGIVWHPTECIQAVVTLDDGFEQYRFDPWDFG